MEIFQLSNYNVVFEPVAMMIAEFRAIRDKNNDNEMTLKEVSFVWFFADIRSDFQNILDEHERKEEIKASISLPKNWEPDDKVMNAIDYYKEYSKTPSSGLYDACMVTAQYIEKKLKRPEDLLKEEDAKGNPLYKLDTLMRMMKDLPDVMEKLYKAKEQVIKEIQMKSQLKGGKTKAIFEDGV